MTAIALIIVFLMLLFFVLAGRMGKFMEASKKSGEEKNAERFGLSRGYLLAGGGLLVVALLAVVYAYIKDSPYEGHFFEWLNLLVRWFHITIGIAWIGASFYFVFLENSLNRTKNLRDELAGNLWAVHGGGFYYLEKYKIAPNKIPEELHWFKYEAYFTWISGVTLLFIVYYFNASGMLLDKNVADISPLTGIGIGIGAMVFSWVAYDLLCKTPLIKKGIIFSLVGFLGITFLAWFLSQFFSSRAVYIHVGAILGTMMAGNVFFIIIPAQKAMVNAAKENKPLNPELGEHAGLRSLHNNYMTLPVLFIMISNHFPSTFGHEYQWAILAAISLASAVIKHYHNLLEKGEPIVWLLPVGITMMLGVVFATAPKLNKDLCQEQVSFTQVYSIIQERCFSCHSSRPTDELYTAPPNGVNYETPEVIVNLKDKILQRVVLTKTMPQNNKTGMTQEERDQIQCWIEQGAVID
ncbi:MAG: urate hydroxylase PuuD [Bacteroidota bacterium]